MWLNNIWIIRKYIHTMLKFLYNHWLIKQLESIFPKSLISVLNSTTDSLVKVSGPVVAVQ